MNETPAITFTDLDCAWPDGEAVLHGLTGTFGPRRTGLIGRNGTEKSTLLRLIAGELAPTRGSITTTGVVGYLPQGRRHEGKTVAEVLGVAAVRAALEAVTAGSLDQAVLDTLEGRWGLIVSSRDRRPLGDIHSVQPVVYSVAPQERDASSDKVCLPTGRLALRCV